MASFVRIAALMWADLLAAFAMYVMMNYLTNVWNLSTTHAAGIINIWNGITSISIIVFAFFVDAFMGDGLMLVLSSIAYTVGLGLLSMSTPPVTGPCSMYKEECIGHMQKALFFTALALIAVGMAGHVVSLPPFLGLQTKNKNGEKVGAEAEEGTKIFWQMPAMLGVLVVSIVGGIALPYIKPWSIRFGIPAICTLVATLLFLTGYPWYEHIKPEGSPLTTTLRVFVAATSKFHQPLSDPKQLYNDDDARQTSGFRCLDKAAVVLPAQQRSKSWTLCSVREVEDTKIGIRMIPMWLTFIVIGIVLSIGNTYFLEQANHMDRKLGSIKVPIPIFLLFYNLSTPISVFFYTLLTECLPKKKYAPPIGIATGMAFSVLCSITAAKVEARRLHVIRDHGLLDKPNERIPMTIFWLVPQFVLLAIVDGMANTSIKGFFENQVPESMHKYLNHFTKGVLGLGTMAGVLSVYVAGRVSERNQKPNWFRFSLSKSRLDQYYWTLAGLSAVNLVVYVIVAFFYEYKEPESSDGNVEEGGEMRPDFQDDAKCWCC